MIDGHLWAPNAGVGHGDGVSERLVVWRRVCLGTRWDE